MIIPLQTFDQERVTSVHTDTLLLIGHGSPDAAGNAEYLQFVALLADYLGIDVQPGFMECAEPSVPTTIERCVAAGIKELAVLPLFLGAAGHQKRDVPELLDAARAAYPWLTLRYGTPLGTQYTLIDTMAERAVTALAHSKTPISNHETALLVVGRGSRDPDSNAEMFKIARLLGEGRDYGWVEVAFQSVTPPDVVQGITRCVRLGARRVVVLPYLLFTGFVLQDIVAQATTARQHYPEIEILMAGHLFQAQPSTAQAVTQESLLTANAGLLAAVARRYHDIIRGTVTMNCDLCHYRQEARNV